MKPPREVMRCRDTAHRAEVMLDYPQARMPCWRRIEAGA